MRVLFSIVAASVVGISLAACGVAEIPGTGADASASSKKSRNTTGTPEAVECSAGTARAEAEKIDAASLTACACKAGGKARCAPKSKLPATLANHLDDCDDGAGACVPDTIIAKGADALTVCAFNSEPGRCVSMCVPDVAANLDKATRGDSTECPEDERCIPCVNPLTGDATGICGLDTTVGSTNECEPTGTAKAGAGVDAKPGEELTCPFDATKSTPGDPNRFAACGTDAAKGRCLENGLVPADLAKRLASCDATGGKPGLCVPEVYVVEKGKHLPTTCSSFAGIEGRCFSTVFKDVAEQVDILQQDACAATERCLPCFNPANGQPTGVCNTVECDSPKKAAVPLDNCCKKSGSTRGKCVPKNDIPATYQERLKTWECDKNTELCVPSDIIDTDQKAVPCDADGDAGVCISDCIDIGFFEGLAIHQGSCRSDQNCIPCKHPLTGKPTGAPGCAK